jgi:hypothetical protein
VAAMVIEAQGMTIAQAGIDKNLVTPSIALADAN